MMLVVATCLVFGQARIISGKVTNSTTGLPVGDVSVIAKGSGGQGVSTKADGSFTINVSSSAKTLIISSIGYTSQELPIGSENNLSIRLTSEESRLDEVVVVGYGTQKERHDRGSFGN